MGNIVSNYCVICFKPLECKKDYDDNGKRGEEGSMRVIVRPCGHKYHEKCAIAWAKKNTSCPLCRNAFCLDTVHQ